jgi:hypothetical protein
MQAKFRKVRITANLITWKRRVSGVGVVWQCRTYKPFRQTGVEVNLGTKRTVTAKHSHTLLLDSAFMKGRANERHVTSLANP